LRIPISEVIPKSRTLGAAAVSGKVEAGGIKGGLKVVVMPGRHVCSVKAIEVSGEARKVGVAGQSVDVGLVGVDPIALFPGAVLCSPEFPVPVARRFEARILTLEAPIPLLRGSQVRTNRRKHHLLDPVPACFVVHSGNARWYIALFTLLCRTLCL